jgi:hypothetical protein
MKVVRLSALRTGRLYPQEHVFLKREYYEVITINKIPLVLYLLVDSLNAVSQSSVAAILQKGMFTLAFVAHIKVLCPCVKFYASIVIPGFSKIVWCNYCLC